MPSFDQVHLAELQRHLAHHAVARELVKVHHGEQQRAPLGLQEGDLEGEALLEHRVLGLPLHARLPRVLVVGQQAHLDIRVGVGHVLPRAVAGQRGRQVARLDDSYAQVAVDEVVSRWGRETESQQFYTTGALKKIYIVILKN